MEIQVQKTEFVRISKEEQIKIALSLVEDHFDLKDKFIKDGKVYIETRHGNEFIRAATEADIKAKFVCNALEFDITKIYR